MRYHLFQKFCGKMVKIKEMSFLSTRGAVCFALNCIKLQSDLIIDGYMDLLPKIDKSSCTPLTRST